MKAKHIFAGCMVTAIIMLAAVCMLSSVGLFAMTSRLVG